MSNVHELQQPEQADFETFWRAYPYVRRQKKALAKAKWDAITNGGLDTRILDKDSGTYVDVRLEASPDEIVEGVRKYDQRMRQDGVSSWKYQDDGKFICLPSTWLNQGRWMDFE